LQRLLLGTTAERLLRKATYPLLVVRQPVQHGYRCALVPVDFSPWSAPALALADALAPHAAVEMLHAYTVPFEEKLRFAGVDDDMIALYREKTRERAAARLHELARQRGWPPSRYHATLHEGDAAPGIVQQAARRACDLIVIGKHGLSAAEELLLGSVTEHVLSEAPCDVLVSPGRASD
ncbi:MAG: universal stress protein, partial [Thiobacillaceae bacterium]